MTPRGSRTTSPTAGPRPGAVRDGGDSTSPPGGGEGRGRTGPAGGFSLIEVILALVLVGAAILPVVSSHRSRLDAARANTRRLVAESLVRDGLDHLRWCKRQNGFDWLWARAGSSRSGISNAGGSAVNPALDPRYRDTTGVADPTVDRFDRLVILAPMMMNSGPSPIRTLKATVTVLHPEDPAFGWFPALPPPGVQPPYEAVTWLGDGP